MQARKTASARGVGFSASANLQLKGSVTERVQNR